MLPRCLAVKSTKIEILICHRPENADREMLTAHSYNSPVNVQVRIAKVAITGAYDANQIIIGKCFNYRTLNIFILGLFDVEHSKNALIPYNLIFAIDRDRRLNCTCMVSYDEPRDDVIKKKPFPRYWPFVREIHRSPVNSPRKGQWRGDLMFSLICWSCSNCIFILNFTPGFNGSGNDNCKTRRETFKFGDLVRLILEVWRYVDFG